MAFAPRSHAAIPASERQALIDLYNSAGGNNWIYNQGWDGPSGSECGGTNTYPNPWFGVTCDATSTHVVGINLVQNYLIGTLPASLSSLTDLQSFNVADNDYCSSNGSGCALGGAIPSLAGLTQLQGFSIEGDAFSGSIPSLTGLSQLQGFDVADNELSGTIPTLSGLTNLQSFMAANNGLTGSIPTLAGLINLTVFDVHGNSLSGAIPSLSGLTGLQSFYVFGNQLTGSLPPLSGLSGLEFFNASGNQLTGSIPSLAGLSQLMGFNVQDNSLSGSIPSLSGLDELTSLNVGKNQLTGTVPAAPSTNNLGGGASQLCDNPLTATPDSNWDGATGVTPWYAACPAAVSSIDLDQFGLTGSWYQPSTSGQGLVMSIYPDAIGSGQGILAAGWYTFDYSDTGEQRWYALQGSITAGSGRYPLVIGNGSGGNFNATPIVTAAAVGSASLLFASCTDALLSYSFSDGSGRTGTIPLVRITPNTTCTPTGDNGVKSHFLLSGGWYDPTTSGQGFYFDLNPDYNVLFAGWYTYAPNGSQTGGAASERWYTIQSGSFTPQTTALDNVPIYDTTGGLFNVGGGTTSQQVGTANLQYNSCSSLTLTYSFTAGDNKGLSGTINLRPVGPVPAGCSL